MNTNDVLNKLIAEIERRIESWDIRGKNSPAGQGKDTCVSRVTELSDLLSFITSLQQEQPEVDLEKAFAHEYAIYHLPDFIIASIVNGTELIDFIYKTARHFAEWGAERQKEQMLKNAVEGEVIKTDKHTSVRYKSFYGTDRYFYGIADKQFKPGDKVRIIVLPIDELLQRQGYEHAERDLVLTIEDMKRIHTFLYAVKNNKQGCFTFTRLSDEQYKEVLRRFNELGKTRKED